MSTNVENVFNILMFSGAAMTGNLSAKQLVTNINGLSIQAIYTGAPTGTLTISASNQIDGNGTFSTWTGSVISISAAGDVLYNFPPIKVQWIKVSYGFTSGSGLLTVIANGEAN